MEKIPFTMQGFGDNEQRLPVRKYPIIASLGESDLPLEKTQKAYEIKWMNRDLESIVDGGGYEGNRFTLSPIDSQDKVSHDYFYCTGLVLSGQTSAGEFISCMTHQAPSVVGSDKAKQRVELIYSNYFEKFNELTIPSTQDCVLFGGTISKQSIMTFEHSYYLDQVNVFSEWINNVLGFEPTIISGPTRSENMSQSVLYETSKRRLHIKRWLRTSEQDAAFPLVRK